MGMMESERLIVWIKRHAAQMGDDERPGQMFGTRKIGPNVLLA
jgi:hypothetical protein